MQDSSPIKSRIAHYADTKNISKRDFYKCTAISRGTLENKTGITEETLTKIFAACPDLSPLWVITGEGPMLKDENGKSKKKSLTSLASIRSSDYPLNKNENLVAIIQGKNEIIKELKERVVEQKRVILHLMSTAQNSN